MEELLHLFVRLSTTGDKQVAATLKKLEVQGQRTEDSLSETGDGMSRSAKKVETAGARIAKTLGGLKKDAQDLDRQSVSLRTELKGAGEVTSGLEAIKNRRDSLDRGRITLETSLRGASGVISELGTLEGVSSRIDGDKVLLTADVDGTAQSIAGLQSLQSVASRIDGDNLRMKVDVDGAPQAISELAAINQVADRVDGRNVNLKTNSGVSALEALGASLDSVASRIRTIQTIALPAVLPGLVGVAGAIPAVVTPAVAALGALAGAMGAGLAGAAAVGGGALTAFVGSIGLIAGPVTALLTKLGDYDKSIDKVASKQKTAGTAAKTYGDAQDAVGDAVANRGEVESQVAQSTSDAWKSYQRSREETANVEQQAAQDSADAWKEYERQQEETAQTAIDVQQANEDAAQDLGDARTELAGKTGAVVRTQREYNEALEDEPRNQAYAALDLADARDRQSDAQRDYNQAVREHGRNSEEATDAARDLQRAELDLSRQQEETADIQKNGSEELRDSYGELVSAQTDRGQAALKVARAEENADRVAQEGMRQMAEARRAESDQLEEFRRTQAEGAARVREAQRAEKDQFEAYKRAQTDGQKQIAAAQKQVEEAQKAAALAADALAQSEKGVLDEIIPLTAAQKRLYDEFQRFKGIASSAFTPAMDQAARLGVQILKLGASYMPRLGTASLATMQALTKVFGTFRRELSQPVEQASINRFLRTIPRFTEVAGNAFVRFSLGMINFFARTLPYVMQFTNYLNRSATAFLNWTRSASGMAQIDAFLAYTTQKAKELWRALQNTGAGFLGLFSAMNEAGMVDQVWGGFLRLTQQFRELTQAGTESRAGVVRFFESSKPILSALWSLVGTLVTEWFRVAGAVMRMRDETGKLVLPQVLKDMEGVLRTIGDLLIGAFRAFGPYIGPITQGLAEFFKYFIAYNPVLAFFSRIIARAATAFTNLDSGTKKAIVSFISARAAFAIFGTAIGILLSPLARVVGLFAGGSTALSGLRVAMLGISAPVAIVVGAIAALAAGFVYLYRNNEQFRNGVNRAWAQIKAFVLPIIRQVAGAVKQGLGVAFRFVQNQGLRLLNWFRTNWPQFRAAVLPILRQIGNGIKTALVAAFRFVLNQGRRLVNWFKTNWPQIRAAVFPVVRAIANVMRNVLVGAFRFALNNARLVVNWFRKNWPLIRRTTVVVFNAIRSVVSTAMRAIWNRIIKPILTNIVRFWRNNWRSIENILRAAWNIVKSVVRTAIRNVLNIIKLAMQLITGDWRGAWKTIKNIARDNWNNIKTIVRNAIRIVTDIVKIGLNQIKGIWERVTSAIRRWVQGWSKNVRNAFNYLINRGKAIFRSGWDGIRGIWEKATSRVREWIQGWSKNIRRIWNELVNAGGRIFSRIRDLLADPMRAAYNIIKDIWNDMLSGIAGVMDKLGMKDGAKKVRDSKMGEQTGSKNTQNEGRKGSGPGSAPARKFAKGGIARGGVLVEETQVGGEAGDEGLVPLTKVTAGGYQAMEAAARMYGYKRVKKPRGMDLDKIGHQDPYDASIYRSRPLFRQSSDGPTRNFAGGGQHDGPFINGDRVNSAGQVQVYKDGTSLGAAYDRGVKAWNAESTPIRHVMTQGQGIPIRDVRMGNTYWAARHLPMGDGSSVIQNNIDKGFTSSNANALAPHELGHPAGLAHGISAPSIMNYGSMYSVGGLPQPNDYAALNQLWSGEKFKAGERVGAQGSGGGIGATISKWVSSGAEKLFGKLIKDVVDPAVKRMSSGNTVLGTMAGNLIKTQFADSIGEFLANKFGGTDDNDVSGKFTGSQAEVAAKFAAESKKRGMPGELPVITALVESQMKNLDYGHADSVGYFQQRPSQGWGTVQQLQDPAYALDAFLDVAETMKGQYGNDAVSQGNWAQAVQRSAHPERYAQRFSEAQALISRGAGGKAGGKAPAGYTDGGMPIKPHNATVEPHDLFLPLDNQRVMRSAQTALGTAELRQDNAMLRNELAGLRSDLVQFGIRVSDMDEPAAQKMGKAAREGAKGHLDSRDGKRQVNTINKSQVNRTAKVGGGRNV